MKRNEVIKEEAIENAKIKLAKKVKAYEELENAKRVYIEELVKLAEPKDFEIKEFDKVLKVFPSAYVYDDNGRLVRWIGDDAFTETVKYNRLFYKGVEIHVSKRIEGRLYDEVVYRLSVDHLVTGSHREYKSIKTVIKKIDEYIEKRLQEKKAEEKRQMGIIKAIEYLESITPKGTIIENGVERRIVSIDFSYNYDKIDVILPNGNSIEFRVFTNTEKEFELSLVKFEDKRISDIKKSPDKLINYLK